MCVGFWRVYEATVRSNGAGSVRGEVECLWVRGVMEVGERSNGVRTMIFFVDMRVERRGEMRWYSLGREDWRDESREERRQTLEKSWSVGLGTVKTEFNFYYRCAIRNIYSVFKITAEHYSKNIFQTWVFQQPFPNSLILNSITKHIVSNFGH